MIKNNDESIMTSDKCLGEGIRNINEPKQLNREVQDNTTEEYRYMDGVLGCVKI